MRTLKPKLASLSGKSSPILTSAKMSSLRSASPSLQRCCITSHLRRRSHSLIGCPNSCSKRRLPHFHSSSFSSALSKTRRIEALTHRVAPVPTRRIIITRTTSPNSARLQTPIDQSKEDPTGITHPDCIRIPEGTTFTTEANLRKIRTTKSFRWKRKK